MWYNCIIMYCPIISCVINCFIILFIAYKGNKFNFICKGGAKLI